MSALKLASIRRGTTLRNGNGRLRLRFDKILPDLKRSTVLDAARHDGVYVAIDYRDGGSRKFFAIGERAVSILSRLLAR